MEFESTIFTIKVNYSRHLPEFFFPSNQWYVSFNVISSLHNLQRSNMKGSEPTTFASLDKYSYHWSLSPQTSNTFKSEYWHDQLISDIKGFEPMTFAFHPPAWVTSFNATCKAIWTQSVLDMNIHRQPCQIRHRYAEAAFCTNNPMFLTWI